MHEHGYGTKLSILMFRFGPSNFTGHTYIYRIEHESSVLVVYESSWVVYSKLQAGYRRNWRWTVYNRLKNQIETQKLNTSITWRITTGSIQSISKALNQ